MPNLVIIDDLIQPPCYEVHAMMAPGLPPSKLPARSTGRRDFLSRR